MEREEHVSTWPDLRRAAEVEWARRKLGRRWRSRRRAYCFFGAKPNGCRVAPESKARLEVEELRENSVGELTLAEFR